MEPSPLMTLAAVAIACASCSAPRTMDGASWRDRLDTMGSAPPTALAVESAAAIERPLSLAGALLTNSSLIYELDLGDDELFDIALMGPERSVQSVDSWASVTLMPEGQAGAAVVESARVYSGRIGLARRGKKAEESLALLALAFTDGALFEAAQKLGPLDDAAAQEAAASNPEVAEAYVGAFVSTFAAAFTVRRSDEVRDLLKRCCQWPSNWNPLGDPPAVSFDLKVLEAEQAVTDFGPGWRMPLEITVDDVQGFLGNVTVVEPGGALHLTAGVVEVQGFAPNRPERTVRLKLTGAKAPRADHLKPEAVDRLLAVKPRSRRERRARP